MHITKESKLRVVMLISIFAVLIMLFGISLTTGRSASAVHDEFKEETTISDEIKVERSESPLLSEAGVIYASGKSGVDTNDGASSSTPVASMTRILELLPDGGTVNVLSPIVISSDLTVAPTSRITFVRTTQSLTASTNGELISITGSTTTVSFSNITLDGANIDSTDTKYLMTLSATTSNVTFDTGCIIENSHTRGVALTSGTASIFTTDLIIRNCEADSGVGFFIDEDTFSGISVSSINLSGIEAYNNSIYYEGTSNLYVNGGIIRFRNYTTDGVGFKLENSQFHNNEINYTALTSAAGTSLIHAVISNALINIVDCCFYNNVCTSDRGIGSDIGVSGYDAKLKIENCKFVEEISTYGIISTSTGSVEYYNCLFKGITAKSDRILSHSGVDYLTLTDSSFINCKCSPGMLLAFFHSNTVANVSINFTNLTVQNCESKYFTWFWTSTGYSAEFIDDWVISSSNFINNRFSGGGIITACKVQSLQIEGTDFINNICGSGDEEAFNSCISIRAGIVSFSMSNCEFVGNVNEGDGGCIYAESYGGWEFNDCVFLNNHATGSGGAIYLNDIDDAGTPMFNVVFNGCEFGYNTAYGGGGAVSIGNPDEVYKQVNENVDSINGKASFSNCYFHNNEVFADSEGYSIGSALLIDINTTNTIEGCVFEYNVSGDRLIATWGLTITNTNLLYNKVTDSDGDILDVYKLNISGLRVIGNTGNRVFSGSDFYMVDSYFSGNYASEVLTHGFRFNELSSCVFEDNNTRYLITCSDILYIDNVDIKNNVVITGLIANPFVGYNEDVKVSITNVELINNTIGPYSNSQVIGTMYFSKPVTGTISNVKFSGNILKTGEGKAAVYLVYFYSTLAGERGLTFENCDFVGNVSGGGLFRLRGNFSSTAQTTSYYLNLSNCVLSGNVTETGMIDILATSDYQGKVNITDSVIYGNTDLNGAVVRANEYVNLNISNTNIFSNMGAKGGAISVGNNGKLILGGGVEFGNNIAEFGSSIYVEDGGEASISNVVLHDMTGVSGVFYAEHGGELNIIGGEIYNNTGENGSAFYYDGSGVISGVVAYNNSGTNGGVLYVGSTGSVVLDDIDFYSNSATNGGAVYVEGTVNFRSGEIRENTATNGGGVYVGESGSFAMSYTERLEISGSSASRVAVYGVVDSNTADYGGGVYIATNGSATINGGHKNGQDEDENSTIEGAGVNNNTTNYNGGGVYVSANATLTILGGEVDGNVNSTYEHKILGVGIYNAGTLIINGGVLRGNFAVVTTTSGMHNMFGGGVYSDSGSIISVTNAYIYRSHAHDGGAMYLKDTQATIKNSYFDSNNANATYGREGNGSLFVVENGMLTIDRCFFRGISRQTVYSGGVIVGCCGAILNASNCLFGQYNIFSYFRSYNYGEGDGAFWEEVNLINCDINLSGSSGNQFSNQSFANLDANKINLVNCNFYNDGSGTLDRELGGIYLYSRGTTLVEGCTFTGQDVGLRLNGLNEANVIINDCIFNEIDSSNANEADRGSPLLINSTNDGLIVRISNCEFRNNTTNLGASAIDMVEKTRYLQVYLSGEIIIENNTTTSNRGALYVGSGKLIINEGTKLVIKDNVGGNIVFGNNADKGVLEGDLDGESKVYVDIPSGAGAGDLIIGGINSNYLMTNSILDNIYLSDSNYGLRFSEEQNALVLYDKSENGEISVVVSDKVVVQEVGESYGLNDTDIEVLFSGSAYQGEYSIEYSLSGEEGTWGNESPVFRAKGEHTIYYRVNADILDEPIQGSVTIKVIGQRIYVKNLPSAKLRYGETLSRAVFGGGLVEDEKGQAVAGVWSFSEKSVVPSDTSAYYEATFTPYNEVYENSNVISVSVPATISYGVVFYANGGFVTDEGDVNNSYTGINNLSQMIEYMSDNGSIIFTETYTVIGDISIVSNKNIDFVRYSTFKTGPMIIVDVDSSLILNGGAGSIVFEGGGALSGTSAFNGVVLDNYGEVNLQTNVIFRGFVVHYETVGGDIYSPIRNRECGALRLNGAQIYGNILRSGLSTTGGIIYNEGELYISGGRYFSNHMDGMNEKGEPSTSIREGVGGFIYNLGSVSMSGGEIFNNRAEYGGAIYVAGGVVTLNGGSIYANQTSLGGGAVYVANGGELILGATNIYGNFATSGENGIENAGGDIFDIDLSKVSSEMLAEIESNNYDMGLKFDEDVESGGAPSNWQDAVILGLLFTAFVLAFVCIVVVRKNRKKF